MKQIADTLFFLGVFCLLLFLLAFIVYAMYMLFSSHLSMFAKIMITLFVSAVFSLCIASGLLRDEEDV